MLEGPDVLRLDRGIVWNGEGDVDLDRHRPRFYPVLAVHVEPFQVEAVAQVEPVAQIEAPALRTRRGGYVTRSCLNDKSQKPFSRKSSIELYRVLLAKSR